METPIGISDDAWNTARHALSEGFTTPIIKDVADVISLASDIQSITAYDFLFVTWSEFVTSPKKPLGLFDRAEEWKIDFPGEVFVVFDPLDDENGFLMIASNPIELAKAACNYIRDMEPEEGPLSIDNSARTVVEASQ